MGNKKFVFTTIMFGVVAVMFGCLSYVRYRSQFYDYQITKDGVRQFGPLKIGGETPIGPKNTRYAPDLIIPEANFYIGIAEPDLWC